MIAMYPHVPPTAMPGVNEKAYAARCIDGDIQAGVKLVQLAWAKGHQVTILYLLDIAFPQGSPTEAGFDNLADALAEAIRHRDFHRVMREGGIPDKDPDGLDVIDLSDIAMGD